MNHPDELQQKASFFRDKLLEIVESVGKVIVGHKEIIYGVLTSFFGGGHVLLEGLPGLGKTLLLQTIGEVLSLSHNRIQFTPDLMPADILGTNILIKGEDGQNVIRYEKGPIFANLVLADEINRATPRTQSALLQAMQEAKVTVAGNTHKIPQPFMVMATQNPIEMEGTYPLPEAQLDRFFFKLVVGLPKLDELKEIALRTTTGAVPDIPKKLEQCHVLEMKELVSQISVADHLIDYAARMVLGTQPTSDYAVPMVKKYVQYGSSPRGLQALLIGAKIQALLSGRYHIAKEDIHTVLTPALQHRIIISFEGAADGITPVEIIQELKKAIV